MGKGYPEKGSSEPQGKLDIIRPALRPMMPPSNAAVRHGRFSPFLKTIL